MSIHDGLERFVSAQAPIYNTVLQELRSGKKRTHWMWFIFPQLIGLGSSETARFYGMKGAAEAKQYMAHPVLGPRLLECCSAILSVEGRTADEIFGFPDNRKLQSCMTLFGLISPEQNVFSAVINKYYGGKQDEKTLALLEKED